MPRILPRTRGGMVRSLLAAAAVGVMGWYGYLTFTNHVAIESRVNSARVAIPAQIDGVLVSGLPPRGREVHRGDILGVIENNRVDDRSLGELSQLREAAANRLKASDTLRTALTRERNQLTERAKSHLSLESQRMKAVIGEQAGSLAAGREDLREAESALSRGRQLAIHGDIAVARLETLERLRQRAKADVERLEASLSRAGTELKAAQSGFALSESYADVSYTRQRLDDIALRLATLAADRVQLAADVKTQESRLEAESHRLAEMRRQVLTSPVDGVVWNVRVAQGSEVIRGSNLVDLADCGRLFVEATVNERFLDRIEVGETATMHVIGSDLQLRTQVRAVMGSSATWDDSDMVATAIRKNPGEARVILDFAADHHNSSTNMCGIGRLAKVTFGGPIVAPPTGAFAMDR